MTPHPMKMVTIICEALARPALEQALNDVGAHGFTVFKVEGSGDKGARTADIAEFANVQFEVILQPAVATRLLERLEREFIPRFSMIAYESDVRVLRPGKF